MHVHPFPARMAPEIALQRLENLSSDDIVLDPMCGSGMVLSQAARAGIRSVGCDLDPLARLISRVGSTRVRESTVWDCLDQLMSYCRHKNHVKARLDWIDNDEETTNFIGYWFDERQKMQLRKVAHFLRTNNPNLASNPKNIIAIALSRLIISKEPKASLARDTAHSRPHKTIDRNDFDILKHLEASVYHVLRALESSRIKTNPVTYLADARRLSRIQDSSVDAIITSPPYLNAIDYMRGHKFSLIWFGYSLKELRAIRGKAIGSEAPLKGGRRSEFSELLTHLGLEGVRDKTEAMLRRYYTDLRGMLSESRRVLKREKSASFVIGNSSIRGDYIKNNEILKFAAYKVGFSVRGEKVREIPNNKRYLPVNVAKSNSLSGRMRTEHVIDLES